METKTRNRQLLEAVQIKRDEIRERCRVILERQAEEKRNPTEDESKELVQAAKDMKSLDEQEADYKAGLKMEEEVLGIGNELGPPAPITKNGSALHEISIPTGQTHSLGQMFVESEQFKSIQDAGRGQTFSTGQVPLEAKGTLLSGTLSPGSGTGGGLLTVPTVSPGVVSTLFQPLTVADILPTGQTNTNAIRYVVEGTATSGAAGVAEAGAKPESTLALSTVDEQVRKIATLLVVSDEMLEDAAQVESYINARLSLFIRIEEEQQIVSGAAAPDLVGIAARSGVNTYAAGTVDNNAVALFKALNGTRGSSLLEPDTIVMHPDNWQATRLLTDTAGQFFGGGPFMGPYGNGSNLQASGQLTGGGDNIWGKRVIVTTNAPGSGTALLGAFGQAAMLYRRSGLTVEATNSHSTYFANNLVAIRAELREALCVFRPSAFTKVTGLD